MKIAVVHSFYSSAQPSGENRVVEDQVRLLREAGHDVKLVARHTDSESLTAGYALRSAFRIATGWGNSPLQQIREFQPDIVHVHNLFPNFGTHWLGKWNGPVIVSLHNYRAFCSNGLLYRNGKVCFDCVERGTTSAVVHACYRDSKAATLPVALSRRLDRRNVLFGASAVVTTSEGADKILEPLLSPEIRKTLIPNFGPGKAREPLVDHDRSGWVAMGRFSAEKGFLELIDQWPRTESLTVIGDGELRNEVLQAATRKGIEVTDPLPIEELRAKLPRFRGLVFPSRWLEVAPQVVVEAMRVGLPIVAYQPNVVASLVQSTGTGMEYADAPSLASSLTSVSDRLDQLSERATAHYTANWTPETWLRRMTALYDDVLTESGHP